MHSLVYNILPQPIFNEIDSGLGTVKHEVDINHTRSSVSTSQKAYCIEAIKPSRSTIQKVAVLGESTENLTVHAVSKMQRGFYVAKPSFNGFSCKGIWQSTCRLIFCGEVNLSPIQNTYSLLALLRSTATNYNTIRRAVSDA